MATVHFDSYDRLFGHGGPQFTGCVWFAVHRPHAVWRGDELLGVFTAGSFIEACLLFAEASSRRLRWEGDRYALDGVGLTGSEPYGLNGFTIYPTPDDA